MGCYTRSGSALEQTAFTGFSDELAFLATLFNFKDFSPLFCSVELVDVGVLGSLGTILFVYNSTTARGKTFETL